MLLPSSFMISTSHGALGGLGHMHSSRLTSHLYNIFLEALGRLAYETNLHREKPNKIFHNFC